MNTTLLFNLFSINASIIVALSNKKHKHYYNATSVFIFESGALVAKPRAILPKDGHMKQQEQAPVLLVRILLGGVL